MGCPGIYKIIMECLVVKIGEDDEEEEEEEDEPMMGGQWRKTPRAGGGGNCSPRGHRERRA
jgi:hypothetical protein